MSSLQMPRHVLIARHGERLDRALEAAHGTGWTQHEWKAVSARPQDPPLSQLGRVQALELGKAIGAKRIRVGCIFSSPFVRCIQTSDLAATGMGLSPDAPVICVEEGLAEECCSFRFPTQPYFLRRFDLVGVSPRVNLDYTPKTRVFHEEMEPRSDVSPVRNLIQMGKADDMPLGDPEEHYVCELCDALPNPFVKANQAPYRQQCEVLQLPPYAGAVERHPGWEITFLRVRETVARLGLMAPGVAAAATGTDTEKETETDTNTSAPTTAASIATESVGASETEQESSKPSEVAATVEEDDGDGVLLVTHGAVSNVLYEVLTGTPPVTMATVGSFYLLEREVVRRPDGCVVTQWRDAAQGAASTAHIQERGNAAH